VLGGRGGPSPLAVFGYLQPDRVCCWGLSWADFQRFKNRFYASGERFGISAALAWVLAHRLLIMGRLVGESFLTGVAFTSIPSGFSLPIEDQGYADPALWQAPDGGSEQTPARFHTQCPVAEIIRTNRRSPLRDSSVAPASMANAPNRGVLSLGPRTWDEAP